MPVMITCHLCGVARPLRDFDRLPGRVGDDARCDHCNRHDATAGCGIIHAVAGTPLCGASDEDAPGVPCLLDNPHHGDHHGFGGTWPQD